MSANRKGKDAAGQETIPAAKLEAKPVGGNISVGPNTTAIEFYEGEGKARQKVVYNTPTDLIDKAYAAIVVRGLMLQPKIAEAEKVLDDLKHGDGSTDKEVFTMMVECGNRCRDQSGNVNIGEQKAMFAAVCSGIESRYADEAKVKGYEQKTLGKAIPQWVQAKTAAVTFLSPTAAKGDTPSIPALNIFERDIKTANGVVTSDLPAFTTLASVRKAILNRREQAKKLAGGNAQTEKKGPGDKVIPGLVTTTDQFTAAIYGIRDLANIMDNDGLNKFADVLVDALANFEGELAEPVRAHLRNVVKAGVESGKLNPFLRSLSERGIGPKVPPLADNKVGVDDGKRQLMTGGSK